MKTKLVLGLLVLMIPLMGFDCVNDPVVVSLNLQPFNATYPINQGNNASPYSGGATVNPKDLYDNSYNLTGASVYDIRVQTVGPDLGRCTGTVMITTGTTTNTLFTYDGPWTGFNTPQSLLTSSYITRNNAGVQQLIAAVVNKQAVTFGGTATITAATVPANCSVVVSAYVQAYGHL
jgi:hypothetical protein